MNKVVIFGAGKIARGFINHLLSLSGLESVFIEVSEELCTLINERGRYSIHVLGNEQKNTVIEAVKAVCLKDKETAASYVEKADLIFTAVGGKNLSAVVPVLAEGIGRRIDYGNLSPLNIITCENWKKPADILESGVMDLLPLNNQSMFKAHVGFSEAVVMRSAIEADERELKSDPLVVNVQDFWSLPVDAKRLKGTLPDILGLEPMDDFGGFLERKFYTYNAANGTVSFVGSLLGYTHITPASRDPFIDELLKKIYHETSSALCKKHGTPYEEQERFAQSSLKKLRDEKIVDTLERNARDPIRKLSKDDRLIGSARLISEYGIEPDGILTSIACAIFYNGAVSDEPAQTLANMRKNEGVSAVLREVCSLDPAEELAQMIIKRVQKLHAQGIIRENPIY